ncbi:serine hydroxymethyltransferase [Candidatus Micrarchaeota archaeon CG_4_10_14_0_2_um_filter_60_11]|nr:MAG: serine hydroxymethyltransferase [Candidatus Micrarchaeota archaeon CG1_02_60_51]PIN96554.1 MAG: serine hydroxymethyltransferase [Candidatus Micrarchaeota archaeon CG10_big_fil_rev_8_21_14_0_10_60_32]PIZ90587.1 MAG: serine hydroxymethyltransferase [Candidatus Micrarchaeota archaeon CG_4_10_14_0_2_um_filter_60_11]
MRDAEVAKCIAAEKRRQNEVLELIPSENLASLDVLEALGSVFNNKYSEGYPGRRYYGGNEFTDAVETLAVERAKLLFGAEHANVQPYSGSPANLEVYFALLEFGDKVMGMSLAEGGHLTHGHKVNFSGRAYNFVQYGVRREDELLDYDEIRRVAEREKPKLLLSGATAYPREIDFKEFAEIAKDCGATSMVDMAHVAGLVAGGVHVSPFPETDVVTTTTHKTLRGPRGAMILCKRAFAERIDKAVFPGLQGGPHEHAIAAKAVCFGEALKPEFKDYARQVVKNAKVLAEELQNRGLRLVSGGTDTHLILVDLTDKKMPGKTAETALDKAGITVNKNMIPFDVRKPWDPSGIRLGTPVLTTRGMKEQEMRVVGELICRAIDSHEDGAELAKIKGDVTELCQQFAFY